MILLALAWASAADLQLSVRGTGEAIATTPVQLVVDGGAPETRITDNRGRVSVALSDGEHTVQLQVDDYRVADLTLTTPRDEVRVFLRPAPPMVIVVEAFQDSPHTSAHSVDAEMALETPGTAEDSFRLVQTLPGVSVQRELSPTAGELAIRGSGPGDNRVYLDGVEIPYLYHFNQYASVLPTSLIGELDLYSSTFGAQYGDAVGAVIEAQTRDEVPTGLHGHVSMNFFMVGASARAPIATTKSGAQWWAAVAGRRSYQDLAGEQTAQFTLWPRFHDYHARLERRTDRSRVAFFAYGAGDRYNRAAGELDVLDPVEQTETPSFDYRRAFDAVGALHEWSGSGTGRIVGALIADRDRGELSTSGLQVKQSTYLSSRLDWGTETAVGRVSMGYELRAERTSVQVESAGEVGLLVAEEAPALARGIDVDDTLLRLRGGLYADVRFDAGAVTVIPGVRFPVDTAMRAQLPDPRVAVRWRVGDELELKLAAGRYQQAAETEHLIPGTGDPSLPVTSAWQVAMGVEKTVANRWEFVLDTYAKSLDDPLLYPVDDVAQVADGGRAFGVELVTRYRLLEVFFLRGWLGLSRSQVRVNGRWQAADGDQPIIVGAVASWDIGEHYTLGVRYRFGSGQPYTAVGSAVYNATDDTWTPVAGELNGARLPAYQKVDLRFARAFTFNQWSLETAVELWYVPKANAQLYPTYNYDYSEQGFVEGPSFLPLLSARATF
ncbi:MAG: hypothetical protein ACJATT_000268 [Myxococcota bacterium]|jgi:hypothetical protein